MASKSPSLLTLLGCGCFLLVLLCGGGGAGLFYFFPRYVKSTDEYQVATAYVRGSQHVQEHLGDVQGFGYFPSTDSRTKDGVSSTTFTLAVEGSRQSGEVEVHLVEQDGWRVTSAMLALPERRVALWVGPPLPRRTAFAAPDASADQLEAAVTILNARLKLAQVQGRARVRTGPPGIELLTVDDEAQAARATELALQGGELIFYLRSALEGEEADRHMRQVLQARFEGTYDGATAVHDVVFQPMPTGVERPHLVDLPGFPAHSIVKAWASRTEDDQPAVSFKLADTLTEDFAGFTGAHLERVLLTVLDGRVRNVATIKEAITGGSAMISGEVTAEEADELAVLLMSGRLPVTLVPE